ncbi:trimeric intracellular cation channel type B-like [Xenia sp. Carnegie-2017]|uniref:trimeric intracellular cation channel type B-like n=1 Tax=Xenia sp. Carnegie-2017 TaxID=2897299 RepID=UPI001F04CFF9|nr:trimeric intracellular cation channel type B-like [Xenia sp. Carnegie-2017]
MDDLGIFYEEASKVLIFLFNKVVNICEHFIHVLGLHEHFHSAAKSLHHYPTTTLLIVSHFLISILKIRSSQGCNFARSNPFASVLSSVLLCFAGSTLQSLLLGMPLVKPYENTHLIVVLILIWYLMYFCPMDLFARLIAFLPVRVGLTALKEVYRTKCILAGLQLAYSQYPNAWFIIVVSGSIRGCAGLVLKPFIHQIVGLGTSHVEFHRPTFTTKMSILISWIFAMQVKGVLDTNLSSLSLVFTVFMILFQLLLMFTDITNPFRKMEDFLAAIFLPNRRHQAETLTPSNKEKKTKSD